MRTIEHTSPANSSMVATAIDLRVATTITTCRHNGTCSTCPYDYCIDESKKPVEDSDRREYLKKYYRENRDIINEKQRKAYEEKKAHGICVRCEKKATNGLYCKEHYINQKKRSSQRAMKKKAEREELGLIPQTRRNEGLCLWCGSNASGGTMACEKHRAIFKESSRKANHTWKKSNTFFAQNGRQIGQS